MRDRRGQPVRDLSESDFEVIEDGVAQTIGSFTPVSTAAAPRRAGDGPQAPAAAPRLRAGGAASSARSPRPV